MSDRALAENQHQSAQLTSVILFFDGSDIAADSFAKRREKIQLLVFNNCSEINRHGARTWHAFWITPITNQSGSRTFSNGVFMSFHFRPWLPRVRRILTLTASIIALCSIARVASAITHISGVSLRSTASSVLNFQPPCPQASSAPRAHRGRGFSASGRSARATVTISTSPSTKMAQRRAP